jgi:predicted RNA binding protein YcfA (HicA-like mRNA interferase family)
MKTLYNLNYQLDIMQLDRLLNQQLTTSWIKPWIASLGRLAITGVVAASIGIVAIRKAHQSYWHKTIFRVQTVDFNLLSHTLPTTLSYVLIQENTDALQRIVNSNYGLFGLVVTDASGREIIAYSGQDSNETLSWHDSLDPNQLQTHPYDRLFDPPPVKPQGYYRDPYATERQESQFDPNARAIGRVYYIRDQPPSFAEDFGQWLSHPWNDSSRFQIYNPIAAACLFGGIGFWGGWEYLLYKKRSQAEIFKRDCQRLQTEKQQFQSKLEAQIQRNSEIIEAQDRNRQNLENSQNHQQQIIAELEQTIGERDNRIAEQESQQQATEAQLNRIRNELDTTLENQTEVRDRLQQQIAQLQAQLELNQKNIQEKSCDRDRLMQQLDSRKSQLEESQQEIENLNRKNRHFVMKCDAMMEKITELENAASNEELETQLEQARAMVNLSLEENQRLELVAEQLRSELDLEKTRNWNLRQAMLSYEYELQSQALDELDSEEAPSEGDDSIRLSDLPDISPQQAIRALERLGFVETHHRGDHTVLKRQRSCSIPRHQTIPRWTLKNIIRQADVSHDEFKRNL